MLLFTPHDFEAAEPLSDDRPYANLAYVSGSNLVRDPANRTAYQSSLTVGFLGLPFAEHLHRSTHDALGLLEPMGYAHQISAGGEPTFRYAVSRLRLLSAGRLQRHPYTLRLGLTGSIGYLTEANAELAFRWGDLDSAWWSTLPSAAEYAGQPPVHGAPREARAEKTRLQLSAGLTLRGRLYNSFLQGQFRDSDVTRRRSSITCWWSLAGVDHRVEERPQRELHRAPSDRGGQGGARRARVHLGEHRGGTAVLASSDRSAVFAVCRSRNLDVGALSAVQERNAGHHIVPAPCAPHGNPGAAHFHRARPRRRRANSTYSSIDRPGG